MFDPAYPIAKATPASYNPRRIDDESRRMLRESVEALGLIRPIIVTTQGTIVAGHQRTTAMKALGLETCPAQVLPPVGMEDEVRFNQLHNASDVEQAGGILRIPAGPSGWGVVPAKEVELVESSGHAGQRNEVLRLLARFGEWGAAVATESGRVLIGQVYAESCKILGLPLRVCRVPDAKTADVARYFGRPYGVFSYGHLEKSTWGQSLAQMFRLREPVKGKMVFGSTTYEKVAIPLLRPGMRILDFGAGQKDYVSKLSREGRDIRGLEFYHRKPGTMEIDLATVHRDIDRVCRELATDGRYDLVVCDSVLNSVDSVQAEADVVTTLSALCKPGGLVVFSGRPIAKLERKNKTARDLKGDVTRCDVSFLDENNFTALYQRGVWLYQHFHTEAQARDLATRLVNPEHRYHNLHSAWAISARNAMPAPLDQVEASLSREFDLPLPGGKGYGRSADIVAAFRAALERGE
jgi:ParB family chromosome partitioning protein